MHLQRVNWSTNLQKGDLVGYILWRNCAGNKIRKILKYRQRLNLEISQKMGVILLEICTYMII